MKHVKRFILALLSAMVLIMSLTAVVSASTKDEYFTFTVNSSAGTFSKNSDITKRTKSTDTKVYVYITSSPYAYIQVRTMGKRQSLFSYYNETVGDYATVKRGVQSSITNLIFERANYNPTKAYITLRSAGSGGTLSGCWSPDSSRNYTVVN